MSRGDGYRTVARNLREENNLADGLVGALQGLAHATRPRSALGTICGTCGGLRPATTGQCDVCMTLRRLALVEEVEHLGFTDSPGSIAARLGYARPDYLARALMRAGRHDLARRFNAKEAA